jgi:replication factor C subunit 3/5
LIILDETDAMTNAAQAALRRVIEKYAKSVRFCLICNYVSKIIPAIQSRCTKFRFAPLPENEIIGRMEHVIASESITINEEGKKALLRVSEGDMRKVLNVLQVCSVIEFI